MSNVILGFIKSAVQGITRPRRFHAAKSDSQGSTEDTVCLTQRNFAPKKPAQNHGILFQLSSSLALISLPVGGAMLMNHQGPKSPHRVA